MLLRYPIILLIAILHIVTLQAQRKYATVSGSVLDQNERPLPGVSVTILGQQKGIATSDSGTFNLRVFADRPFALVFSYAGYKTFQQNFLLNEGEAEQVTVRMEPAANSLDEVVVTDHRSRTETGLIRPNPKSVINIPSPVTGVESFLKVFVGSNNELTSQYTVRGGSYDENLIYVNDFEIFRPYLVQSGQQEGLSFINPELVQNINFYTGGFQARYGDKMSSVLDVQYNKPRASGGSAYISLLEQGFHFEGIAARKRLSYLIGVRNRSNQNLLNSQETQGTYSPSSDDIQTLINYQFNKKWQAEFLGNISQTKFGLIPQFSQLTTSVLTPYYTSSAGLDVYFNGQEKDRYGTIMTGLSTTYQPSPRLKLKWMASRFENDEQENRDITGQYLFGERDFDPSSAAYGKITNPLGAGAYQDYGRDQLSIVNYDLAHKGSFLAENHLLQWGAAYERTDINANFNEWEYKDSAGYSLPFNPGQLELNNLEMTNSVLQINKLSGFFQDNIAWSKNGNAYTVQAGARFNYNDLNHEFLASPRVNASWKPAWKRDIIFRAAGGRYVQPPFFREMVRYDGSVNTHLLAQKSWQGVLGFDYNFVGWNRPLRLSAEAYYKYMTDVDPYDINNVRIRYFGENNARAFAEGIDLRLFGELVKDAESWVSIGLMHSMENISNSFYEMYRLDSLHRPVDSSRVAGGWYRRPTDRLLTFGMFFQDYLSTNKNFKVYLNTLYGTNLPFNIPGSVQYRNALTIPAYLRIDIGFSALLLDAEKSNRRSHSPFRNFENIWATFEVFNLIDRSNTISYLLIKDFQNNTFALPNRLTPRLLNLKFVARW